MCGIVGIVARNEVKQDIYDALTILQHRGQDAAGMVTSDGRRCFLRKANGLVRAGVARVQDRVRGCSWRAHDGDAAGHLGPA